MLCSLTFADLRRAVQLRVVQSWTCAGLRRGSRIYMAIQTDAGLRELGLSRLESGLLSLAGALLHGQA